MDEVETDTNTFSFQNQVTSHPSNASLVISWSKRERGDSLERPFPISLVGLNITERVLYGGQFIDFLFRFASQALPGVGKYPHHHHLALLLIKSEH